MSNGTIDGHYTYLVDGWIPGNYDLLCNESKSHNDVTSQARLCKAFLHNRLAKESAVLDMTEKRLKREARDLTRARELLLTQEKVAKVYLSKIDVIRDRVDSKLRRKEKKALKSKIEALKLELSLLERGVDNG